MGLLCALLLLPHWHHAVITFQGGRGGRVLFWSLIACALIEWNNSLKNKFWQVSEIYPFVGWKRFATGRKSNVLWYAVVLDVAKRSLDRSTWQPVAVIGKKRFNTDVLQVMLKGTKASQHHRGTQWTSVQTLRGHWNLSPLLRRGPFCDLHYLRIFINGRINFSTFFSQ